MVGVGLQNAMVERIFCAVYEAVVCKAAGDDLVVLYRDFFIPQDELGDFCSAVIVKMLGVGSRKVLVNNEGDAFFGVVDDWAVLLCLHYHCDEQQEQ